MIYEKINQEIFIMHSFLYDISLESLVRMQYELLKKGMSLSESSSVPLFEFEAYSNLLIKDLKNEAENQ